MRFYSRNPGARYVIRQAYREMLGLSQSRIVPGFTVEFHDGLFDSGSIKDKKQRKEAEEYLQNHRDFGVVIHVAKEPEEMPIDVSQVKTCVFGVPGPQGFTICGDPVEKDSPYCAPHGAQIRQASVEGGKEEGADAEVVA